AAMVAGRPFICGYQEPEFRLREPQRNGPSKCALAARRTSFSGNDEHVAHSAVMRPKKEVEQEVMRLVLEHAVQVDPCLDGQAPLRELAMHRLFERLVG